MSNSASESDERPEFDLQRALLAMDEELRQLQATSSGTTTPVDNEPASVHTQPVWQLLTTIDQRRV